VLQPPKLIAGVLGLAAFAAACITGLASGADPIETLWRALVALLICSIVGAIIGRAGMVAVAEQIAEHIAGNPVPSDDLAPASVRTGRPDPDAAADAETPEPDQAAPPAQAA